MRMHCPRPFSEFQIRFDGLVHCCCEGWLPKPIGNILDSGAAEIWNGPVIREIRESIVDGSFRFCVSCPYLPGPNRPVVEAPLEPPSVEVPRVRSVLLNYDRSCNLACPSCRLDRILRSALDPQMLRVHEAFLRSGIIDIADRLYISGAGDPFASPLYWHILTHFPDLENNHGLELALHTNGQLLDESHWLGMGRARTRIAELGISIDAATEKTYLVNRGSSWERLWRNIDFVVIRRRAEELAFGMGAHFVIQANNWREIVSFAKLALGRGFDWVSFLYLRNWGTYSEEDYRSRAVHLPGHPEHAELLSVLSDPIIHSNPRVFRPALPGKDA
jgi:MoaA/NifB/PqqE/SkfB family radical SAM enzyme